MRAIQGVSTTTAGFVGPTRAGPVGSQQPVLTALGDFEHLYGDAEPLVYAADGAQPNFMWHAVRAFFAEGGKRLYVQRVFRPLAGTYPPRAAGTTSTAPQTGGLYHDGHARARIGDGAGAIELRARFPGAAGNLRVRLTLRAAPGQRVLTLAVAADDPAGWTQVWNDVPLGPALAGRSRRSSAGAALPVQIEFGRTLKDGSSLAAALTSARPGLRDALDDPQSTDAQRSLDVVLTGGNDGERPGVAEYAGRPDAGARAQTGLEAFAVVEDIAMLAAPGATFAGERAPGTDAQGIVDLLVAHAARMQYRIALLDSSNAQSVDQVRALRARLDSKDAALYYPWVRVLDPLSGQPIDLPPSGFVAGIYARGEIDRGVGQQSAEFLSPVLALEQVLEPAQQDALDSEGVNGLRFVPGRGFRLWGARTLSGDPEWKYVNLRRYLAYLEHSLGRGTQGAVFEPNGEALWAAVRRSVEDFLLAEWQKGALLGDRPEEAYFVRCDRTTMTQDDLDNGRLVCLVGVAPLRPAEFVIFRIGQWTADRKP